MGYTLTDNIGNTEMGNHALENRGTNGTKLRRLTAFSNGEIDTSPGKRHRLHPGVNGKETYVG